MDLTPYIDGLQRDLATNAAPGGPEVARAADMLTASLEASVRLCLLEALSDAAAEITSRLGNASVDVRLRGREADLTVTEFAPATEVPPVPIDATGELARITLRMPETLKEQAERAAATEGISVNSWLVRAVAAAVGGTGMPGGVPPRPGRSGRRLSGWAQA